VRVDVRDVRGLHVARVEAQDAGLVVVLDAHAVDGQQAGDDLDVTDVGNVQQFRRRLAQQGGHHRFRDEVLRSADRDLAGEGSASLDGQRVADRQHVAHEPPLLASRRAPDGA
jgi:hypothetical protein